MSVEPPKHIEVDKEELEAILHAVKPSLTPSQYKILESAIRMLVWLQIVIKEKSMSIARLARMFFGKRTESLKNLKNRAGNGVSTPHNDKPPEPPASNHAAQDELTTDGKNDDSSSSSQNDKPAESPSSNRSEQGVSATDSKNDESTNPPQPPKKGHGRRPLNDYNVSKIIYIPHKCLKAGQKCPLCAKGTLYNIEPQTILLIQGRQPLTGEAYSAQGLRCNLCQQIFRATFPKEVITRPKADMSARAIVCLAKYQLGTPLYRLETWQKLMRLPISDAEMWEWTESVALVLYPIHQALLNLAAKGDVIHNDDTTGKILDLMAENRQAAKNASEHKTTSFRKGIFTSALLSKADDHQIAIYMTGRKNSGENMDELLDRRPKDLKRPIQACDGSSQNSVEKHETDVAKCFNHARHNFCELVEVWPNETLAIVEMCNAVFMNDRKTKQMKPDERLQFHQKHSSPIMSSLKSYCNSLIEKKQVEPNSSFGKAINYLNNHWKGLTLFLRDGKAPVSNNDCERTIKSSVLIRKNSYFYKSCWGAFVGDTLLSIIRTCNLNGINPYDYLIAIQANAEAVEKSPDGWLPWNYSQNASAPLVNAYSIPVEEIQYLSNTGPPTPIARNHEPCFEKNKKTLRERARDFFKRLYPEKWQDKLFTVNS